MDVALLNEALRKIEEYELSGPCCVFALMERAIVFVKKYPSETCTKCNPDAYIGRMKPTVENCLTCGDGENKMSEKRE